MFGDSKRGFAGRTHLSLTVLYVPWARSPRKASRGPRAAPPRPMTVALEDALTVLPVYTLMPAKSMLPAG